MASKKDEDEFKLPLRQWLKNKIDQRLFPGLEWIDEKCQIFKIPWTQKGHPGWEEHYKVFISWARHRGRLDENKPLDYNKLKGNFRCVLHKSEDFSEIKEKSKTNQQTGNYKVYQILPANEVKAKTEKRKRIRSCSPESSNTASPVSSHSIPQRKKRSKTTEEQTYTETRPPIPDTITIPPTEEEILQSYNCLNVTSDEAIQVQPPMERPGLEVFSMLLPEIQVDEVDKCLYEGQENILGPEFVLTTFPSSQLNDPHVNSDSTLKKETNEATSTDPFEDFLEKTNFERNQVSEFLLSVVYGNKMMISQVAINLSSPRRILYGDPLKQLRILQDNESDTEDFYFEALQLPQYDGEDAKLTNCLKLTDQGMVLKIDEKGNLIAKRLCQSRVWLSKDFQTVVKLNLNEETELFSYSKYSQEVYKNINQPPSWKVELAIGENPTKTHVHNVRFTIEPILAPFIENYYTNACSSPSSQAYSNETSIDKVLRMHNKQSMEDQPS